MLLNFLVFGLIIQPIVMGVEACQAACLSCAPACPACCRDNTCSCDYIQFVFFAFGGMMQIGTIVLGCSLINSVDSGWDDAYSRSGEAEGTPYLRFEGGPQPYTNGKLKHLKVPACIHFSEFSLSLSIPLLFILIVCVPRRDAGGKRGFTPNLRHRRLRRAPHRRRCRRRAGRRLGRAAPETGRGGAGGGYAGLWMKRRSGYLRVRRTVTCATAATALEGPHAR